MEHQSTTACRLTATKDKSEEEVSDQNRGSENISEQISPTNEIPLPRSTQNNVSKIPSSSPCRASVEASKISNKSRPTTTTTTSSGCGDPSQEGGDEESSAVIDAIRSNNNKRRMAPKPPAADFTVEELLPASTSSLFARNPGANFKSDSPVVREKEKRERASSCSPKFRKAVSDLPDPTAPLQNPTANDPTSRRSISLSQDNLTSGPEVREEKKRSRPRFSLKRFLRMGSRKDVDMVHGGGHASRIDEIPSTPQPKPRLEIIHPLELDGAAVEVVGNDRIGRIGEDQPDSSCAPRNDAARQTRSPLSNGSHAGESLNTFFVRKVSIFCFLSSVFFDSIILLDRSCFIWNDPITGFD